jgi:hypothetical protein
MMDILAVFTAAVALGAASTGGQAGSDLERETELWEIAKSGDIERFSALLDPQFVAVYASAINDKEAEIAAIGEQKLTGFTISNFTSRQVGPGVILATYSVDAQGSFRGTDISGRYNAASLWRRSGDGWMLAYHSEAKAP